ncbi:MAG: tripartite tricarboxylate transporter substrate binding protein, partial [Proteobacteria bacterium]|nr:tripartite tricarboxylate transporter substrate binding protein [Pseudomonadota bacterium]
MSAAARVLLIASSGLMAAGPATAADVYPSKTIRLVVPFAPGGGSDIVARLLSPKMTEALGQTVVVDNRAGASANLGAAMVAKAAPDGYTLLLANANYTINPSLFKSLPFDPVREFAPVALLANVTNVLAIHPSIPAKSVKELISFAKAHPGQLNFASPGNGTSSHLAGELFRQVAKIEVVHIPYKGATPAITDLIAGQVSFTMASVLSVLPYAKQGRLRMLAVTTAKRSGALPDIPTISEAGLPGFEVSNWYGILATGGTPRPAVDRLNSELARIARVPDLAEKLAAQGADPATGTPEEFERF